MSEISRRLGVLALLRSAADRDFSVDEVAATFGIHRSVAHDHLESLAAAGMVKKGRRPSGRGRPANSYRYAHAHTLLSRALIDALVRSPAGAEEAKRSGRRLGAEIVSLGSAGSVYREENDRIHAVSCMFADACRQAPDVVCGLHSGIIEAALKRAGRPASVEPLGPDGIGGCTFRRAAGA